MSTEYQLADTIEDTLVNQCNQAIRNTTEHNEGNTGAILSEWVLDSGSCLLTEYLNKTTESIKETLMYVEFNGDHLIEGEFWFDPEVQLPTDNN